MKFERAMEFLQAENVRNVQMQMTAPEVRLEVKGIYEEENKGDFNMSRVLTALERVFPGFSTLININELDRSDVPTGDRKAVISSQVERLTWASVNKSRLMQLDQKMKVIDQVAPFISTEKDRKSIEDILAKWEANKANPDRNNFLRTILPETDLLEKNAQEMVTKNPHYYSIGTLSRTAFERLHSEGGSASFTKQLRRLLLREPQQLHGEFPDLPTLLMTVHELTHARQDAEMVKKFNPQTVEDTKNAYDNIFKIVNESKLETLVILDHEIESKGNEAAVFHALTASLGENRRNLYMLMQHLRWPADRLPSAAYYVELTEAYLRGEASLRAHVEQTYRRLQIPFFKVGEDGTYVPE